MNNPKRRPVVLGLMVLLGQMMLPGCYSQPVMGGTAGKLTIGGAPMSEVQISVYQQKEGAWEKIGFGDATSDGSFELVKPGAAGPLVLEAGEYRFTLESIGAPLRVPPAYQNPASTPLSVVFPTGDGQLLFAL